MQAAQNRYVVQPAAGGWVACTPDGVTTFARKTDAVVFARRASKEANGRTELVVFRIDGSIEKSCVHGVDRLAP